MKKKQQKNICQPPKNPFVNIQNYVTHDTYGYDRVVVKDKPLVEIYPTQGGLVLFNSRNFHEVEHSENLRISMGGHVGLNPLAKLFCRYKEEKHHFLREKLFIISITILFLQFHPRSFHRHFI